MGSKDPARDSEAPGEQEQETAPSPGFEGAREGNNIFKVPER